MLLLRWFKPLAQAFNEGEEQSESQESRQKSVAAVTAGIKEPGHSDPATDSDFPGESTDTTEECIGYTPSFTSESDEQHHHMLPPQPNQHKLVFPKHTFGKQKRSFSAAWNRSYPWLHYVQENDMVLCFYCASAVQHKIKLGAHFETNFTEIGFSNWQKALQKFSKHEQSACHWAAFDMISKTSKPVDEMLSASLVKERADNRKALLTIISTIHFLAQQGLPLRGSYVSSDGCETNSYFLQLLDLCKEDVPVLNT